MSTVGTDELEQQAPPVGEEIHLPGPTFIPLLTAFAIMLIVIGTTVNVIFMYVGGALLIYRVARWIRDVRRDVDSLPEEHH